MTWTSGGDCRGVVLRREHGRVRVARHWQGVASEDDSTGQALRRGLEAMQVAESDVLVAGCADLSAGCADLEFPSLPDRELRNSLQYELAYHAPIQQERLVWGYRVLGSRDSKQAIRLFYMREADWHRWLDELGSLGRGVDVAMPPHACLDPVLAGQTCFLPAGEQGGYVLESTSEGRRTIQGAAQPPPEGVGAAEAPLAGIPDFDAGPLLELDDGEQRAYLSAVLLALYGLSSSFNQDRKTRILVPYDLRPVRNRYSRLTATVLLALLVLLGLYGGWREYAAAAAYHQALVQDVDQVEAATQELQVELGGGSDMEGLAEELQDLPSMPVSFGASLAELTQITPPVFWVQSLTWQEGRLDVQFVTQDQEANIRGIIEESELFSGVSPQGVRVDRDGTKTIRLRMYATLPGNNDAAESVEAAEDLPDAQPPPEGDVEDEDDPSTTTPEADDEPDPAEEGEAED